MNLEPRFSRTTPSEAAKKARMCETKWRSSSVSFSQWARSLERSTSSAWGLVGGEEGEGKEGRERNAVSGSMFFY